MPPCSNEKYQRYSTLRPKCENMQNSTVYVKRRCTDSPPKDEDTLRHFGDGMKPNIYRVKNDWNPLIRYWALYHKSLTDGENNATLINNIP